MNKTMTALAAALMIGMSGAAMAKCDCSDCYKKRGGGFMEGEPQVSTVKEAKGMADDSMVTLQGKIEKRIKKDKYTFQDGTGTMTVEIDKDIWNGQTVTPQDTVLISGELDKDGDRTKLDVERLMKKQTVVK